MIPYPYQLPHPQHLVATSAAAPINVPDASVYSYSQGETGSQQHGVPIASSTARPLIPAYAPPPVHIPYSPRPVVPLGQRYTNTGTKYITTIEPQVILGPYSLPPTLQHFPSAPYNYPPAPQPPFNFESNHFGSFLSNRRPLLDTFTAPSSLRVKPLPQHGYASNHLPFTSFAAPPSYSAYNTIAYSVPMGPKLKRDSNAKH